VSFLYRVCTKWSSIWSVNRIFILITMLKTNLCESHVEYDRNYVWQLLQHELWCCSLFNGTYSQLSCSRPEWLVLSIILLLEAFLEKSFS
jgi:hypothetical protein